MTLRSACSAVTPGACSIYCSSYADLVAWYQYDSIQSSLDGLSSCFADILTYILQCPVLCSMPVFWSQRVHIQRLTPTTLSLIDQGTTLPSRGHSQVPIQQTQQTRKSTRSPRHFLPKYQHITRSRQSTPHTRTHNNVPTHASHHPRLRPPTHHRPHHQTLQQLTGDRPSMPESNPTTSHRRLQMLVLLASADRPAAISRFHT
jgi:hypothetical protein